MCYSVEAWFDVCECMRSVPNGCMFHIMQIIWLEHMLRDVYSVETAEATTLMRSYAREIYKERSNQHIYLDSTSHKAQKATQWLHLSHTRLADARL